MRSFVAITLPDPVREALAGFAGTLEQESQGAKWVEPKNLHLTINFLGNLEDAALQRLCPLLRDAAARVAPFEIALGRLGAFPNPAQPRVIWIGLAAGAESAVRLHAALEAPLLAERIAQPDAMPFRPHVTLARVRSRSKLVTCGEFFETLVPPEAARPFLAERVTLYMSELTPTGPIYTVMLEVPLRG